MRVGEVILRPWVSILGATNQDEFREQLKSKSVSNGFLNRFLVLPRYRRVVRNPAPLSSDEIPESILEKLKALATFADDRYPMPQSTMVDSATSAPVMVVIEADREAEARLEEIALRQDAIEDRLDDEPLMAVWVRYAQMVRRVALVVAVGRHPNTMVACRITAPDVEFADRLVSWSLSTFVRELSQHMADTQYQADALHVLATIRKSKSGTITRTELHRSLNNKYPKIIMDSIMHGLLAAENIKECRIGGGTRGPKPVAYRYIRG
jgi:hypothetical protein